MFVSGVRGKALIYVNNRPKERFLRIQFHEECVLVSQGSCNKLQVGGLKHK